MKILPSELFKAVQEVSKVKAPSAKKYPPVLDTVHLQVIDGALQVTRTNKIDALRSCAGAISNGEPLNTCVPLKPFFDWLRVVKQCYPSRALAMSLDATTQTLHIEIEGERSRTEFLCIDGQEFPECAHLLPQQAPSPWIVKARSTDDARPAFMADYGRFCADGFRIHYDPSRTLTIPPAPERNAEYYTSTPPKIEEVLAEARGAKNTALVPAAEFIRLVKQAKKINPDRTELYFNGRLDITTKAPNTSIVRSTIEEGYDHTGENVRLPIMSTFLLDALAGMQAEDLILGIYPRGDGQALYLTDGTREAVIMGMLPE